MHRVGYKVKKKVIINNIISIFLAGLLLLYVFYKIGIREIFSSVVNTPIWALAVVFLLYVLMYILHVVKWKFVVDKVGTVSFSKLMPIFLAGGLFNQITPGTTSGGQPYRALHLSQNNKKDFAKNLSTTMYDFATNAILHTLILVVSFFVLFSFDLPLHLFLTLLVALLAAIGLVIITTIIIIKFEHKSKFLYEVLAIVYHFKLFHAIRKKYSTVSAFTSTIFREVHVFVKEMIYFFKDRSLLIKSIIIDLVMKIIAVLQIYILFIALGVNINPFPILVVFSIAELINFLTFTPGGIGVVETLMIGLYGAFGIPLAAAAVVTGFQRFFLYIFEFVFGYISYIYLKKN
tara:strand:+ start:1670 stop:2710 length:1041 start_codon:yes stop_codon:yes gene_type:complete